MPRPDFRTICVFCGSSSGGMPEFATAARSVGALLARGRTRVVYGGGRKGLMGQVADATLAAGGEVVGIMPRWLVDKEVAHEELTHLHIVDTLHERRQLMYEFSDAFLVLPGGLGTFEELFEVLSWAGLGLHDKPCGVLDIGSYFDFLPTLLERAIELGFVRRDFRSFPLVIESSPRRLLLALARTRSAAAP